MLIGVDHGNKQIKTVHGEPFVSGLQQSLTRPFGQSLQYCGTYYTLSNERIPFHKDTKKAKYQCDSNCTRIWLSL